MPFLALAWPFVKTWWKVIVPVVLLLLALGYVKILHMEIDHYKSQVIELKKEAAIVAEKNKLLEQAATDISKKFARQLENRLLEDQKRGKLAQERIKNDKETASIKLSPNIVSLFNAGKPDNETTPTAISKDDGEASSDSKTLKDLLVVTAVNDINHEICIKTVDEWQNYWKEYSSSVSAIGGSP